MKRGVARVVSAFFICALMAGTNFAGATNWGLSYRNGINQPPTGEDSAGSLAQYGAYFMGDTTQKVIYLTFDCGYENGNTAPILDVLKKQHVPAAFFIVGHFIDAAPALVRRMADEGHLVGNHSTNHPNMTKISAERFSSELRTLEKQYRDLTDRELAPFFRPPEGVYNTTSLSRAQALGYHTVLWSVAYRDWDEKRQPSRESALSMLNARIHNGAIPLLHAVSRTNASILDELIAGWKEQGYTFAALSALPGLPNPTTTAIPSSASFLVNGQQTAFCAYNIAGSSYVKLRDLAAALQSAGMPVGIDYDAATATILLTSGQDYVPLGSELSGTPDIATLQMLPAVQKLTIDGASFAAKVFASKGATYLRLRDICEALSLSVAWDGAANSVQISK